jgi:hypothetical protein
MVPYTIFISCLSLGLPILFMGIFLFIYSKKEGLGILFKIASFSAVICGTIVFLSGVYFALITTDLS